MDVQNVINSDQINKKAESTEDLLRQILELQKKKNKDTRISTVTLIVIAVLFALAIGFTAPRVIMFFNHAETSLAKVDQLATESEKAMLDLRSITSGVDAIVKESNETIAPKAVGLIDHAEKSLTELDKLIAESGSSIAKLNTVADDMDALIAQAGVLIENSNAMVENNTDAITETVNKLNNVDFEALNQAIHDLSAVIEPLARFASMFK
jgi:vacuolar-type H+-ATPase subunit I/STV1